MRPKAYETASVCSNCRISSYSKSKKTISKTKEKERKDLGKKRRNSDFVPALTSIWAAKGFADAQFHAPRSRNSVIMQKFRALLYATVCIVMDF